MTQRPSLNLLDGPWIPLLGSREPASLLEILAGERDAADFDWPRDDFRVFTRLLLSALVQAVVPAKDADELVRRIEQPMARAELEERFRAIRNDFELLPEVGPGFLQSDPVDVDGGAARFVFGWSDLSVPADHVEAISLPAAAVALFIEQTYAGGAGRGHKAGPGGQPGAMTILDTGSVRQSIWANTLATGEDHRPRDPKRPWGNGAMKPRPVGAIGLVEGLFFQPRAVWLVPTESETCSFSGAHGPTVRLAGFASKNATVKEKGALWVHPNAPMVLKSQGDVRPVLLEPGKPAWTGLAQLLDPVSRDGKARHPREGAALVLQQWRKLPLNQKKHRSLRLQLLDYDRDKASLRAVFFESYPISERLGSSLPRLRQLAADAEEIERLLHYSLLAAHDREGKRGGFSMADATSAYWHATEPAFLDWLSVILRDDAPDEAIDGARERMATTLRRVARRLFDEHVAASELDVRMQARIAEARRWLAGKLSQDMAALHEARRAASVRSKKANGREERS